MGVLQELDGFMENVIQKWMIHGGQPNDLTEKPMDTSIDLPQNIFGAIEDLKKYADLGRSSRQGGVISTRACPYKWTCLLPCIYNCLVSRYQIRYENHILIRFCGAPGLSSYRNMSHAHNMAFKQDGFLNTSAPSIPSCWPQLQHVTALP